jgi:hypothetical protein
VTYDAGSGRFTLPEEQAMALADESSPCFLPSAFQVIAATFSAIPKIEQRFKTGKGVGWDQYDHRLFEGTERFFRPNYLDNLVANWIPSLGAQAGEARLRDVVMKGGLTRFRPATRTPFNLALEARP